MIRAATVDDVPALVAMARRLHETAEQAYVFSPDHTRAFLRGLILRREGLVLVLERSGAACGMLVAAFGEHPLGAGLVGQEWGFWVDPDARAGRGAIALLAAYEADARRRGCRLLTLASLRATPARGDVLGRLYQRFGFRPREQHYDKAL